jgi:lysophospholipase L1-like esterase
VLDPSFSLTREEIVGQTIEEVKSTLISFVRHRSHKNEERAMKQLSLAVLCGVFSLGCISTAQPSAQEKAQPAAKVKIVLTGDSTVALGGGWGAAFCALTTPNVECVNLARNGRSSKSYYDEGLWKNALEQHPDYILIQFGHNDMPGKGPSRETIPETTYAANLRRYIEQARAAKARPVIVTSLSRRTFKDGKLVLDLEAYAVAAKRVAAEEKVPLVDLNAESVKLLESMTQEQADQFNAVGHPDAAGHIGPDRTHLNASGATVFGRMVADDLARDCVELRPDIKGTPTAKSGAQPHP